MKILLDESLPKKLKVEFGSAHEVYTVGDMKWNGVKNGALLGLMVITGFEMLITIDKNLEHQQNLDKFSIIFAVLDAPNNKIETLKPYMERLKGILQKPITQQILSITI